MNIAFMKYYSKSLNIHETHADKFLLEMILSRIQVAVTWFESDLLHRGFMTGGDRDLTRRIHSLAGPKCSVWRMQLTPAVVLEDWEPVTAVSFFPRPLAIARS